MASRQVLVQRKPSNWRRMTEQQLDRLLIRNQLDLIGKPVHIRRGSSYYPRLLALSEELGGDIDIRIADSDLTTEGLIAMVAEGVIDYTVADESIAMINSAYYPNIDIKTPVSFPQRIAWAVRKSSPKLLKTTDAWIEQRQADGTIAFLQKKYFKARNDFRTRRRSEYFVDQAGGRVSAYDDVFRKRAAILGWDWRLLASLVYQESRFDPDVESWAGAVGLMQIMPATGEAYGETDDLTDPEENIITGTNYLLWLQEQWEEIPDPQERIKFVLASYNVGKGHINDARALAEKYGRDPDRWEDNVARYLAALSDDRYFNDPVVKHGYCRGEEPVRYVEEILERFNHYKNFAD